MKIYGTEVKGPLIIDKESTLSAWTSADEGRLVYAEDVDKVYYGSNTAWNVWAKDVSDTAYAASWDGVTDVAPSKNAVYDELQTVLRGDETNVSKQLGLGASDSILCDQKNTIELSTNNTLGGVYDDHTGVRLFTEMTGWTTARLMMQISTDWKTYGTAKKILTTDDVSDAAYGSGWDGVTDVAPSKNAVYDELQARPRRNAIINGNMSVWQRGTTTLTNPANQTYFADRFMVAHSLGDGTYNAICEAVTPIAGFPFANAFQIDCTHIETAVAAGEFIGIYYKLEGYDFVPFEGNTATLSFWVKATKTGVYCVSFRNSAINKSYVAEYTVNTTNTWEKKTVTLTFNSGGTFLYTTGIGLRITWAVFCGSDFQTTKDAWQDGNYVATSNQVNGFDSTDNNFSLTGVQLELGSSATEFEYRPYAEELALCQRYYQRFNCSAGYNRVGNGIIVGSVGAIIIELMCAMRALPSFASYGTWMARNATMSGQMSIDTVASDNQRLGINFAVSGSDGAATQVLAFGDTTAYYYADAEL